ncbi:UNVERIFIED_CONTAM: hypothetical protein GTU68_033966 [Idotea baltica]|nr:hypothetical protein [Idotea baltica]
MDIQISIPYSDIPNFPVSTVHGHKGRLVIGVFNGKQILVMQGRVHFYEGYNIRKLGFPIWVLKQIGIKKLIITNASGAANPSFVPGDLMLINDHINFAFCNPLMGPNLDELGARFPDTSQVYNDQLKTIAKETALSIGLDLKQGNYFYNTGPCYETPAEVIMARKMGADAVGMSTVPEAIVAAQCKIEVLGLSFISNMAAGISETPLSHEEVIETMDVSKDKIIRFLSVLIPNI